ncbi:MAG: carbohydrate porin [Terriglobales bacterium]
MEQGEKNQDECTNAERRQRLVFIGNLSQEGWNSIPAVSRAVSHSSSNYVCTTISTLPQLLLLTGAASSSCPDDGYASGPGAPGRSQERVMSAQRVRLTNHLGRINLRFVLTAAISMVLMQGWSVLSLAQQTTSPDAHPMPPAQSVPAPPPSAQTQTPDSSNKQSQAPGTPSTKPRKLNCQHPANPSKRRFGCKDEDFDWEETLTSDWNGARAEARKLGITPSGSYFSALQTNAMGGPHQIWGYTGQLTTAVDFNFEKLLKIPGMSLYVSDSWGTGGNLTSTIDSVFPVNVNYAVGAFVEEVYLQQKLFKDDLTVAAGRLAPNYTFAGLPVFDNYVSLAINPAPISLASNDLSYTGPPPGLEWGAQAIYNITPVIQVAAGVFNSNPHSANNGNVFAFQQCNKGALVTAQLSYLYNQGPNEEGKQGQYTAGFFEDNNSFATLPVGSSKSDGNSGVFVLGQQMVYRPGAAGTSQGLTIWGAWAYSSKQSVSPMPVFAGAGLSYEGLIKKRKDDIVSAGWIYGQTSSYIPNGSAAKLFEANYQWVAKRYLTVVPDFQRIWDTNGTNGTGAVVLGVQVNLTF